MRLPSRSAALGAPTTSQASAAPFPSQSNPYGASNGPGSERQFRMRGPPAMSVVTADSPPPASRQLESGLRGKSPSSFPGTLPGPSRSMNKGSASIRRPQTQGALSPFRQRIDFDSVISPWQSSGGYE